MSDRIDISEPVKTICARLGLDPTFVGKMIFTPTSVSVDVYVPDESGAKHITEEGEVAMETREFAVST